MKNISLLILAIAIMLGAACGDDDSSVQEPAVKPIGDCHYLFDANGQAIGVQGVCTGISHWEENILLSQESDFLLFPDSVQFTSDFGQFSDINISVFPIPAQTNGAIFLTIFAEATTPVFSELKVAMVDDQQEVLLTFAQPITTGSNNFQLSLDGLPAGKSYRIYYQFADSEISIYYWGYGDFFICDDTIDFSDCLE